jgi:hypothetical protein
MRCGRDTSVAKENHIHYLSWDGSRRSLGRNGCYMYRTRVVSGSLDADNASQKETQSRKQPHTSRASACIGDTTLIFTTSRRPARCRTEQELHAFTALSAWLALRKIWLGISGDRPSDVRRRLAVAAGGDPQLSHTRRVPLCVFRPNSATDSVSIRPPIPFQFGHSFRPKSAGRSG